MRRSVFFTHDRNSRGSRFRYRRNNRGQQRKTSRRIRACELIEIVGNRRESRWNEGPIPSNLAQKSRFHASLRFTIWNLVLVENASKLRSYEIVTEQVVKPKEKRDEGRSGERYSPVARCIPSDFLYDKFIRTFLFRASRRRRRKEERNLTSSGLDNEGRAPVLREESEQTQETTNTSNNIIRESNSWRWNRTDNTETKTVRMRHISWLGGEIGAPCSHFEDDGRRGKRNAEKKEKNTKGIKRWSFFSLSRAFGTPVHHTPSRSTSKSQPTVVKQYNDND